MIVNTYCFNDGSFSPELFYIVNNPNSSVSKTAVKMDRTINWSLFYEEVANLKYVIINQFIDKEDSRDHRYFFRESDKSMIILYGGEYATGNTATLQVFYDPFKPDQKVLDFQSKYEKPKNASKKEKINFIFKSNYGFNISEHKAKSSTLLDGAYNISVSFEELKESIENNLPGLILFDGPPGTGKSYLLRYLVNNVNKKFVYLPKQAAVNLADPAFLPFALENLTNAVLFIEDAEEVLRKRDGYGDNAVSTILNVTDGLMGDLLNLKIVCTVNVIENIDPALLREGRLLHKVEFKKLNTEQANKVLKQLGKEEISQPGEWTLAELYNSKRKVNKEVKRIGFKIQEDEDRK